MADNSPTSPIDVINLALDELKEVTLQTIDQDTPIANMCKRHYDLVRKSLLRSHVFNFSKTEGSLARASAATSVSYDDVYLLPNTFLRFISIGDVLISTKRVKFDIRSFNIAGNFKRCVAHSNGGSATLAVLYIRNVTEVSEFDPLFTTLLKFKLASAIAPGITLKPSIKADIKIGLADAMLAARSIDGQERPPVRIQNSKFLSARKFGIRSTPIKTVFGS